MRCPAKRLKVIQAMYNNFIAGTINIGDIGEIVAVIILLFTLDKAASWPNPAPVELPVYLENLFPKKAFDNVQYFAKMDKDLKSLIDNGKVFFNHIIRLIDEPTVETLRNAYLRSAAVFVPSGHKGCNIIIPILLPEEKMSYILVQVKNHRKDRLTAGVRNEACRLLRFAADHLGPAPHIGLQMCLCGKDDLSEVKIIKPQTDPTTASNQGIPTTGEPTWENNADRIVIVAVGLSKNIYPGIGFANDPNEKESDQTVEILKSLLNCTGDGINPKSNSYFKNLAPLG